MGLAKEYKRHSAHVIKSARWKSVRYLAKKRDGWKCVKCGATGKLEVDHIKPVRDAPELAYELSNLQTLCKKHHSEKTRIEVGLIRESDPKRQEWRNFVDALARHHQPEEDACLIA